MTEEEKEEIKKLIKLLYRDNLSQFGKRNLETYINKLIAETEKVKQLEKENKELKEKIENKIKEYEEELKYEITRNEAKIIIKVLRDLLKE